MSKIRIEYHTLFYGHGTLSVDFDHGTRRYNNVGAQDWNAAIMEISEYITTRVAEGDTIFYITKKQLVKLLNLLNLEIK